MYELDSEATLAAHAAACARRWLADGHRRLLIGLQGELGSGKTVWTRAMLRGLGYSGRVPSPTYTLLEHYEVAGLNIVHMDLYRLAAPDELENLGIRDWLAATDTWVVVEWPERAPFLECRCDLLIRLEFLAEAARQVRITAQTEYGNRMLQSKIYPDSNYSV